MSWYITVIKNYFNFKGRARRKEYWMFVLFNFIFGSVIGLLDRFTGLQVLPDIGMFSMIYSLFIWIPSFSLAFRRLHDTGRSAAWLLLAAIPIIGWIWLFVYMIQDGITEENRYGTSPKLAQFS